MAVPYALGEGTEQNRCVVDSLREAIRLKDSLYSKASVETLAKYNAEFGNDQLQEENHFVSRSRTYIIILSIMLLAVAVVLVLRQRRLIALQKARLSEDTKTLEELQLQYGRQQDDKTGHAEGHELSEEDKQFLSKTITIITNQIESNHVNVDELASALAMSTSQFRRRPHHRLSSAERRPCASMRPAVATMKSSYTIVLSLWANRHYPCFANWV
jgi:hypothetical protein